MFGLLNPIAFWLAPLIAAPLLIHFLGRREPQVRDFPSLLLVRARITRSMRRHRLKNWLQLLLRTLAVLLLVLAAANPVWRPRQGMAPPQATGILLHNGAYSGTLLRGETAWDRQQKLRHGLDSMVAGHAHAELLFGEIGAGNRGSARFGTYSEALARLIAEGQGEPSYDLFLPVFDWGDLLAAQAPLELALRTHPNWRLLLAEYPEAQASLSPFRDLRLEFPQAGVMGIHARLKSQGKPPSSAFWIPTGEAPREIPIRGDSLEIRIPLTQSRWVGGMLSLASPQAESFAFPREALSVLIPPPSLLCHEGKPFASLASLGEGGIRLKVQAFANSRELSSAPCAVLVVADPPDADANVISRAAEILRRGGKVMVGLGRNTDLALWNREFLLPLRVGRLTALNQHAAEPVQAQSGALSKLGWDVAPWGLPGEVKSHVGLLPDTGTSVLLAAGGDPILIHRRIGLGALLLWTTDIDDPEWTDLGLGPWVTLAHQRFLSGTWNNGVSLLRVAADSTWVAPGGEDGEVKVTDPSGLPFLRIRSDAAGWRIGPFDAPGLYRVETGKDTLRLAVGLAGNRLDESNGTRWEQDRENFLRGFGGARPRILTRDAGNPPSWYGGNRLRIPVLAVAALLLLLEGMVSLLLTPNALASARD